MLTPVFSTADGFEDVTEPLDNIANEPIDAVSSPIASVEVEVMTISPEGRLVSTGEVITYEYIPAKFDSLGRIVPVDALALVDALPLVIEVCINGETYIASYEAECLDTPKTPGGVEAYFATSDIAFAPREYLDAKYDSEYPNAVRVSSATYSYNSHAYAWLGITSHCINDPSVFYTDGSYGEVSDPQPGDIICYFDANGNNIHSGIVSSVSGEITVTSKWEGAGVYSHSIYDCPCGEAAATVKYYRSNNN